MEVEQSIHELELAFHEYVTDFKTQLCKIHVGSAEDFVNASVEENFTTEWKNFSSRHRKKVDNIRNAHDKKFRAFDKQRKLLSDMSPEDLKPLINKVCEVRSNVQYEQRENFLVIKHPVIVLSKILPTVESSLEDNKSIKHVHFEAKYAFYIDTSIEKTRWHGVSIRISAEKLECVADDFHFDVSGNDAPVAAPKANSAKIAGQNGYDGKDGESGENGGSIDMLANTFIGISKLSIYSNGGNGANGQDGGDGCDGVNGADGRYLSLEELKKNFESPMGRSWFHEGNIKKAIRYLRTKSQSLEISVEGFNEKGCMMNAAWFSNKFIYYKGVLDINVRYEYCFSKWKTGSSFYAFFMGENGNPGTRGGSGGLGGAPGKQGIPGSINICLLSEGTEYHELPQIFRSAGIDGIKGCQGKNGRNGRSGKHGEDVAVVDHSRWFWPVYYNGNRYRFENLDSDNSFSVWCCKTQKYRQIIPDTGLITRREDTENQ